LGDELPRHWLPEQNCRFAIRVGTSPQYLSIFNSISIFFAFPISTNVITSVSSQLMENHSSSTSSNLLPDGPGKIPTSLATSPPTHASTAPPKNNKQLPPAPEYRQNQSDADASLVHAYA
jgi:hypothetical protein